MASFEITTILKLTITFDIIHTNCSAYCKKDSVILVRNFEKRKTGRNIQNTITQPKSTR